AVPGEASTANNHASRTVRVADEAVLLLQEADPWGTTANEDALNALGIPYLKAGREAFSMDFSRFYKLVLASDQTYDFYNALAENESVLTTYVEDGGTLELHAADYGWNGGTWDRLPGGFTHIMDCIDNVRIMEPSHPLFTTPNAIDEASLQDWWCSSHGALSAMPDATSSLIESGGVPVAVESYLGTGTIVLTLQPVELSYTYWAHPMILNLLAYRPTREATDGAMARLIAPKHVAPDQEVTINVVVANAGTTNMPPTDVALFVEGSATQHALTGVLAPNAVARLDFVVSFTTMGAHRVEASLAAQSGESNLANNARNATIQVRPPGPIAAVDLGTPEGTGVLDAVGIPSCDIDASGLCYDLLTPSDLRAENFAGRRTLYVGWTDGANSDAIAALRERAADIATFVSSGGGLVAWSEPYLGYDDWIPEGASVQLLYTGGDSVVLTDAGAAHPALAGQTNESLSNWGNSYHHAFQAWPSYLGILAVTGAGEALTLAGSYGDGCVLVTGQDPDWHGHYTRQPGALMMANATLHWASACTGAPPTLPDLAVSSVTATPNPANVDDPVTIGAVIENRGNATATDATVRFYVDDDSVADILILTLPPGSAQRVNVTWRAAAGNHTVSVVADPDGSIPESNESNNKGLSPKVLVVTALTPDLVVINVTATPRDPVPGTFITVKALIRNEGSGKAPTGFDVALAVDGDVVATQHFPPGMPAGYVLNVTMGTSLAEGTHELTIIADVNNDVKESDESNNDRSIYLDVVDRPLPDLAVRILGVEKASIQTDYAVVGPNPIGAERVIIQACNAGAGPLTNAIVQVSVEVRDPRDSTSSRDVGTTSVGTLKAGECTVVEQRWVPNAIGDVRFIANGITPDIESTMRNNVDTLDGFVVIGGFGGVLLPLP
ncbi:MAG: CARDB domain-containing protein, partial [Candidatus Thermoplasmatota archaeon]